MKTTEPQDRAIRESLAAYEAMRRLGYTRDDIYLMIENGELFTVLKTQGKEFSVSCGVAPKESDLRSGVEWWNDKSVPQFKRTILFEDSIVRQNSVSFVVKLQEKGFVNPITVN